MPTVMETRREQMFPHLEPAQIDRIRHFGEVHAYAEGETLVRTGERGHGLVVILSGEVAVTRRDEAGHHAPITTHVA